MNINILADIAINNGLEVTLEEENIAENLKEKFDSIGRIEEQVIHGDVSIIPVHDITEAFIEYHFNTDILEESVIGDLKSKIRGKSIEAIEKDIKSFDDGIKKTKDQLKELKSKTDDKSKKLKVKLNKQLTELTESRKGLVQALKQKKAKQAANESYAVTMDSLVEVVEALNLTLEEAMTTIKEANEIECDVTCVVSENITEYTTVQEFCELVEELNENNIKVVTTKELVCEDFITEAGKISDAMVKAKEKIKNMPKNNLEKTIKQCEESNKKLKEEMDKIDKMSKDKADKYCKKESAKNIAILTAYVAGSGAVGGATGSLAVYRPLLGMAAFIGGLIGITKVGNKLGYKGKGVIGFSKSSYKSALRNTIKMNNETIKECNLRLKDEK